MIHIAETLILSKFPLFYRSKMGVPIFSPNRFSAEPPLTAISRKPLEPITATGFFGGTAW
jgi:hypothetical protein